MISLNPFRKHGYRLIQTSGLVVEIIRLVVEFYEVYKDFLLLHAKSESEVSELNHLLVELNKIESAKKRHHIVKQHKKQVLQTQKDFETAFRYLGDALTDLEGVVLDDDTLLFREANSLEKAADLVSHPAFIVPINEKRALVHKIDHLIERMVEAQHHFWIISKAEARGFTKIELLSLRGPRSHKRRLRHNAVEVRTVITKIDELQNSLDEVKNHVELHRKLEELIALYHEEFEDLEHIMHEGHVLIHTSEKLFKEISGEAKSNNMLHLKKSIGAVHKKFGKVLKSIQQQALREYMDLEHIKTRAQERHEFIDEQKQIRDRAA
ncbi:hypothetical protein HN587_04565 [Candidatus Woesearchaeota archaeon]|jgi:hypothetical protein|nr:hypothetical protein [Candidatus Woesearchaeota archaeon]